MTAQSNDAVHATLDLVAAAETAGEALDRLPYAWPRFLSGPDADGFHFSMKPEGASGPVQRIYDRGMSMGRGTSQIEAIRAAVAWIRERMPKAPDQLDALKERAIALTLATETLNELYVRLDRDGQDVQAAIVNVEVQRLASEMDTAQFAILAHFGRGDGDGWDDSHPLNEALWSGQATPDQIREYA